MKITHIKSQIVKLPGDEPLADGPATPGSTRDFVTLTIGTDQGIEGIGFSFFGGALTGALKTAIDALGGLTCRRRPAQNRGDRRETARRRGPERARAGYSRSHWLRSTSRCGTSRASARSAAVASCSAAFARKCRRTRAVRLMRHFPLDVVVKAGPKLVAKGFRQMKTQMALPGDGNPSAKSSA
jgi:L-alanine-DL-glutamate epimerase-like enolase superfamily enzyme